MNIEKPLTAEEFKSIYSKVPRVCVELVIKTDKGVLLTLRNLDSYKNLWHFPGGNLYYQESLAHAVQRIAHEELGISVVVDSALGHIQYISEDKERGFGSALGMVFLCHPTDLASPIILNEEASEFRFFVTIPENIVVEHRKFLREIELLK